MVEKLRRKFILITMIAVVGVLTVIMFAINLANYLQIGEYADQIIDVLVTNNGKFNDKTDEKNDLSGEGSPFEFKLLPNIINEETPYETRYFTVRIDTSGETTLYTTNTANISAVSSNEAARYAQLILDSNKSEGYIGVYRFRCVEVSSSEYLVIFVDCTNRIASFRSFLIISIIVSIVGTFLVLALVWLLSKKVFSPIAENMEKQKRFITEASHELKTPLTIISANNELIEMEYGANESTQIISKQVNRMTSMVKNLTALARIDEAQSIGGGALKDVNLSSIIADQIGVFKNALESNNRSFIYNYDKDVIIKGNEPLIRQLISIILENASKYAMTKTVFEMQKESKSVVIHVSNDAVGINEGNMDKCFERFYRSPEVRGSSVEGSGIGLSMAKEIVDIHQGTITAYGKGDSIFNIAITLKL